MSKQCGNVDLTPLLRQLQSLSSEVQQLKSEVAALNNKGESDLQVLKTMLSQLLQLVQQLAPQIVGQLTPVMRAAITEIVGPIAQGLGNIASGIASILNRLGGGGNEDILGAIDAARADLNSRIQAEGTQIRSEIQRLGGAMSSLSSMLSGIKSEISSLGESLQGTIQGISGKINQVLQAITTLINAPSQPIDLSPVLSAISDLKNLLSSRDVDLSPVLSAISSAKGELLGAIRSLGATLIALQAAIKAIEGVVGTVLGLLNRLFGGGDNSAAILDAIAALQTRLLAEMDYVRADLRNNMIQIAREIFRRMSDNNENFRNILDAINSMKESLERKIGRIYAVLGGSVLWGAIDAEEPPEATITPEAGINFFRLQMFPSHDQSLSTTVPSLAHFISAYIAVLYQREGLHRYPATVPTSLADDGGDTIQIHDSATWQEWEIKQLDALIGKFPVRMKYKDANGDEHDLIFENEAEMLSEIMGILLSLDADTDVLQQLAFKGIAETIKAQVSAVLAADYAKGNAEYLGYKGSEEEREIPISITPGAKKLTDMLKTSKKKMPKWVNKDNSDVASLLNRILFGSEVVKAAFFRMPEIFGNELPGDRMREDRDQNGVDDDQEWAQLLANLQNPPAGQAVEGAPRPKIRNLAQHGNPE